MFNIRPFEEGDYNFAHVSWKFVLRGGYRKLKNNEFHDMINPIIESKINNGTLLIACSEDDPQFIYGFIAFKVVEGIPLIQMAYIKQPFRKFGILKRLIEEVRKSHGEDLIGVYQRPFDKWIYSKFNIIYRPSFAEL